MAFVYQYIRYQNYPTFGNQQQYIQKGIDYFLQQNADFGLCYIITYITMPNMAIDAQIDTYYPNPELEILEYQGTVMASSYLGKVKPAVAVQKDPNRRINL